MTNGQARLFATVIAMYVGVQASSSQVDLHINIGIAIVLISAALFITEYVRLQGR